MIKNQDGEGKGTIVYIAKLQTGLPSMIETDGSFGEPYKDYNPNFKPIHKSGLYWNINIDKANDIFIIQQQFNITINK
ncbi:MAG: hypothetical protein Q8P56_01000 [Candidatus Uhrbacteria bacterium]|nr:hypothetical protein [Candidatus Uhrbacteria bacterium]